MAAPPSSSDSAPPNEPSSERGTNAYRRLDAARIQETIQVLAKRIHERFPNASLAKVADELETLASEANGRVESWSRPNLPLRAGVLALLTGAAWVVYNSISGLHLKMQIRVWNDLIQTLESSLGSLFFIGTGVLFLVTIESRLKRRKALTFVHQLRSLAHIVDMHQLTKDPEPMIQGGTPTKSSPKRTLSPFELVRYLDYCSEILALIGKLNALTLRDYADPVVLSEVDAVENLTTGLSRKIWQKLVMMAPSVEPAQPDRNRRDSLRFSFAPGSNGAKRRRRKRA